ncbi:MAG: hypothetical protein HOK21_15060 [Rhodospirillaceae bacterium]|nr:hypothetical protein [Rhodospirillaceae bacterium]MBT4691242.1 hypothetical protein [Rhodospirillaceae bacterium]MBT5525404.1 hypothetical protein [Rhodospirillaceae bacterium]MBT5880067.1 hypothetical protein [Rhodospirillaceae bacterium]MBT6589503.1 hypothetical protein [Rhodospirillaceae bacterium]
MDSIPDKALEMLLVFFGFVGMLTPLALWITWSRFTFYLVLGVGALAITVFVLLSWFFNARYKARNGGELPKSDYRSYPVD